MFHICRVAGFVKKTHIRSITACGYLVSSLDAKGSDEASKPKHIHMSLDNMGFLKTSLHIGTESPSILDIQRIPPSSVYGGCTLERTIIP